MPLYEGRSPVGSQEGKAAVVVDIGTAYTKVGFAGEFSPRLVCERKRFKTKPTMRDK